MRKLVLLVLLAVVLSGCGTSRLLLIHDDYANRKTILPSLEDRNIIELRKGFGNDNSGDLIYYDESVHEVCFVNVYVNALCEKDDYSYWEYRIENRK